MLRNEAGVEKRWHSDGMTSPKTHRKSREDKTPPKRQKSDGWNHPTLFNDNFVSYASVQTQDSCTTKNAQAKCIA